MSTLNFPHLVQPSSLHWTNHWIMCTKLMICTRKPKGQIGLQLNHYENVIMCEFAIRIENRDHCTIDGYSELFGLALIALNISDGASVDAAVFW